MTENFGAFLKHERELRGVSLEEISGTTKIHMRYLLALEENQFENLPGEVFVKGYIRSYANSIGTNADEILNTYDHTIGRDRLAQLQQKEVQESGSPIESKKKIVAVGGGTAFFLVIGIAAFWMLSDSADEPLERARIEGAPMVHKSVPPASIQEPEPDINFSSTNEEPLSTEVPLSIDLPEEVLEPAKVINKSQASPSESEPQQSNKEKNEKKITPKTPPSPPKKIISSTPAKPKKPPEIETFSEFRSQGFHAAEVDETTTKTIISGTEQPKKTSQLSDKEVIIQTVPVNVAESEIAENPLAVNASPAPELELKIAVQGNSWFNMKVDNSREEDFILPEGSSKTFTAKEQFVITIGNTEGTVLSLNNRAIPLPEGSGQVVRDFLINSKLLLD
jgi:cytoskeletal protein RodZ